MRLWAGLPEEEIVLHGREVAEGCSEEWLLDAEGRLVWRVRVYGEGVSVDGCVLEPGERVVASERDLRGIPFASLEGLAEAVGEGDLLDRVAWRRGREGKPGYTPGGFYEERVTWRLRDSGMEERGEELRRLRAARGFGARRGW